MSAQSTTTTTATANIQKDYHPLNNHQHLNRIKSNSSNSINSSINISNSALNNGSVNSSNKSRSPMSADENGVDPQHHLHQHQQQKATSNGMFMINPFRHSHQHHNHQRGNNNSSISSSTSSLNMRKSYPSSDPNNASFSSASVAGSIQDDNMSDQCGLTQAGLEEYNSRSFYDQPVFHHQKQSSYAQSEGYHSYVSSSDSSSATPFLDRLRQETELLSRQSHHWSQNDLSPTVNSNPRNSANITIDNSASNESTSSTETLKWLGSMSDVSVASHATNSSAISGSVSSSSQLIVHSSRVLTPKRHNSESVLYMNDDQMSVTSETSAVNCSKMPNLYQHHQHYHLQVSVPKSLGVDHQNLSSITPSSGIATVSSSGSSASPTSVSPSIIATTTSSTTGSSYRNNHRLFPVSTYTEPVNGNTADYQHLHQYQPQTAQPQQQIQHMTPMKLSSPQSHNWQSVADRISDFERQQHLSLHHHHALQQQQQQTHSMQKYTYIDPSKTHRVSNPTLKAFQKNAVQSYFERQQHNAKENIKNQAASPINNQNRPQSLQLANSPKEVVVPHMRSSLPNNFHGPNFSHKSPSAQQIINNSLLISPISDDSSPYVDCNSVIPPPPPPRSRSLMPIRRSSSASDYAKFRESFIRAKDKPNVTMITSPENIAFNDCGVPPPPPPPPRGRNAMPLRRTSSASEYVAFREKNIKARQNLLKDLVGPIIMGPIIAVDDWVPERPPKNPHLRIPSPDLPPPPLQVIDTDSNLLNQDEPLPPPPPEILRHIRQSSDGEIKPPSPTRRNSFAGSPSRKTLFRATTFENLSPPSVPKKPLTIDLIQQRPSSSLAQSQKAHKVILNGKLESPTSPNCAKSPSTPQTPEPMTRTSDPRASVRKRSHNSYPLQPLSADSKSPGNLIVVSMKSPPPLKPRMPIAGQEMRASSVAISSKLRRNSKASYLPRQTRDKLNTTDPDHGSYKLTLTSNEDSINHSTSSYHEEILSSKCNNLPDVLPVGVKMQSSSPSSSSSSPRYGSNNNISMITPPHTAPPLISNSYPMKSMFHFQAPSPASNYNRIPASPISTSPPSYLMATLNRSTSSPLNSNDSISPKYMSQSTIDLKKTHVFDSNKDHFNMILLSPAQSENNINSQDNPLSPYSAKHEFRKMEVARKLSLEEHEKCEGRIVRAELVNTTLSTSPPSKSDEKVIRKDSLRGNIEKITQLQSKLMSAHLVDSGGERTLLGYTAKTVEIKSKIIEPLKIEQRSPTRRCPTAITPSETNESERISKMDSEIDGLKLMQRTEIILRLNAPTTEAASQTDETLENELSRIKLSDYLKDGCGDRVELKSPPIELTPRKKHPEEIDCDNLSKELISYLAPSDKLHQILAPKIFKSTSDYVSGLYNENVTPRPNKRDVCTSMPDHKSDKSVGCELNTSSSVEVLTSSETINYYGVSESKAKIMTRYSHEVSLVNGDDCGDLTKKKEELVNRLTKKLLVLGNEQRLIAEESSTNHQLGSDIATKVSDKLRPIDASKFRAYIDDVGHITMLLLSLSGRLAKVENTLHTNDENSAEKKILQVKRDRLLEQLEEAKRLKEDINRRGTIIGRILAKSLTINDYADYDYFINMKAKLIVDSRENSDKIKLGEEQLKALKDALVQSEC